MLGHGDDHPPPYHRQHAGQMFLDVFFDYYLIIPKISEAKYKSVFLLYASSWQNKDLQQKMCCVWNLFSLFSGVNAEIFCQN